MRKTRQQIEAEVADFRDRFRKEQKRAEEDRPKPPPGWLLDRWHDEKLKGKRR